MEEAKPEGLIQGSYTISLDIAGRRVQIGGYIQQGETKEQTIAKMTLAQECIDYQLVRADLKSNEGKLKGELAQLESLIDEHERLVKKQRDLKEVNPNRKMHAQDEAKLRASQPNIDQLRLSIKYREKIIAEDRKALGLDGAGVQ